jgi:hypothetical protein
VVLKRQETTDAAIDAGEASKFAGASILVNAVFQCVSFSEKVGIPYMEDNHV